MARSTMERDWQVGKSLTQCLEYMLYNEVSTDVTFHIRPTTVGCKEVSLSAHKLLLCARSPVFEAMFSGNFAESNNEVLIIDSEPEPFKEMLRYIYTDSVDLKGDNVQRILNLARKYILEDLVSKCIDYLDNNLCSENVCDILDYSIQHKEETLIKRCLNVCTSHTADVVGTHGFYRMSQEALLTFLRCDVLPFLQEEMIAKACIEWAEQRRKCYAEQNSLRDILGPCVYQIRCFQLTLEEFAKTVGSSTVLTEKEKNLFLFSNLTKRSEYAEMISNLGFNTNSRCLFFERAGSVGLRQIPPNMESEKIRLEVYETYSFLGIGLLGGANNNQHDV